MVPTFKLNVIAHRMLVAPTGVVLQRLIVCIALEQHKRFVLMNRSVSA